MSRDVVMQGRNQLAVLLLDAEPNPADQVPLLMSMQDDKGALDKALESQDPDLIYLALLHLLKRRGAQELFKVVMKDATARALMLSYSALQDDTLLRQLCETCDVPMTLCAYMLPKAFKMPDLPRRTKALEAVKKTAAQSSDEGGKFLARQLDDQLKLQQVQVELEQLTGKASFLDTSAAQTVRQCFALNQYSKGLRLAKDLNMSEKLLWSLKVEGLAEGHDWKELDKLSNEKKVPPIGLEPFVEACIKHDRLDEAGRYVERLTDMSRKAELCVRMGLFKKAAEAGIAARDLEILNSIRHKCTNPADMAMIDNLIATSGLA